MSTDLSPGTVNVTTLNGANITVTKNSTGVFINNAKVIIADVVCTNGVIHAIDAVLMPPMDIVDTAIVNGNFNTLVKALNVTGLDTALRGVGPFTVFAPTDAAFALLDQKVLTDLVTNHTDILSDILLYHVVSGKIMSTDLSPGIVNVTTLNGANITVTVNSTGVFINDAQVIIVDVVCTNGVIHAIDAVLMPPMDIVDTAIVNGNFNTLVTALNVTGLDTTLRGDGPFTVFAPTDAAFALLDPDLLNDLVTNDTDTLTQILLYHVVSGTIMSTDLTPGVTTVTTLPGSNITVTVNGTGVFINDAQVIIADVVCTNGVIHVINLVLIPPT
jgi:transforming growth factor-beta-induced protein